jgi:diaminopimelate decarboxylase
VGFLNLALVSLVNKERIADAATAGAWSLFGLSMTQINEALQALALLLTIVATGITIYVHCRNRFWTKK